MSVTYCVLDVIRHTAPHAVREAVKLMTWGLRLGDTAGLDKTQNKVQLSV